MKLSVPLLLLVASLSVAVPPLPPAPQSASTAVDGLGGGKSNRKCGPKCQRRKHRLLGAALPVNPVNPPGPPEDPPRYIQPKGPPKEGSAADELRRRQLLSPPSAPVGPPAPSLSFRNNGPSSPQHLGPPGPRLDVYGGGAHPPPGRGPGNSVVVGPPGLLDLARFCGKNQVFMGNNLCVCAPGFVMTRNRDCKPARKTNGRRKNRTPKV